MRLILIDLPTPNRIHFEPLAFSRPIWELRCGMTSLAEKLAAKLAPPETAGFVPEYLAEVVRSRTTWPINDPASLTGADLLVVDPRLKADALDVKPDGPSEVGLDEDGNVLYARIAQADAMKLEAASIEQLLDSAKAALPTVECKLPRWNYVWDLVLANPGQIAEDFAAAGRSGIEGTIEQPRALRGSEKDLYVAPGALVHPMVVIDAVNGPVYIDADAEILPFSRIEGPCYVGPKSMLLASNCREGNSIGPVCRVGGEVEESIIQGYSNKYHDGFLGHAYVGEWVNLGAMTTNSDLKNDYSPVSVVLDGRKPISTGSTKVGSLIGDHTKTSIGTLLNTGAYVGAMALLVGSGKPLPKYVPSFTWYLDGAITKGFGKGKLYETAKVAMSRRKMKWTDADEAMWDAVFEQTAEVRDAAVKKGRRQLLRK